MDTYIYIYICFLRYVWHFKNTKVWFGNWDYTLYLCPLFIFLEQKREHNFVSKLKILIMTGQIYITQFTLTFLGHVASYSKPFHNHAISWGISKPLEIWRQVPSTNYLEKNKRKRVTKNLFIIMHSCYILGHFLAMAICH